MQGNWYGSKSVNQECYTLTLEEGDANLLNDTIECKFSEAELLEKGYVGTDGTVVGIFGGSIPFTLAPSMPRVTEHSIVVDADKKKLNVTLKVTAN